MKRKYYIKIDTPGVSVRLINSLGQEFINIDLELGWIETFFPLELKAKTVCWVFKGQANFCIYLVNTKKNIQGKEDHAKIFLCYIRELDVYYVENECIVIQTFQQVATTA